MIRFLLQKDVVLDQKTGLMWPRNASLSEFPLSWAEAFDFVTKLNASGFGGAGDWRLPSRPELVSLISREAIHPSLPPGHPFLQVFHGYYWTATACARLPGQAWYVHLGGARIFKGMKANSYMVWPVRGTASGLLHGANGAASRFTAMDGVVQDEWTGLFWTLHADAGGKMLKWAEAFGVVEAMNRDRAFGRSDWRVPQIEEMESLVDLLRHSPALPEGHPFENVRDFYWSAATSRYDETYAWTLYLKDGAVGVGYKRHPEFYLWPVAGKSKLR